MNVQIHIENFKCFKDFDIELGDFTVLIGPNDSGKSAFLQAIRVLAGGSWGGRPHKWPQEIEMGASLFWQNDVEAKARIIVRREGGAGFEFEARKGGQMTWGIALHSVTAVQSKESEKSFEEMIGRAEYYRLDPVALKTPCPVSETMTLDMFGANLATMLANFLLKDRRGFFKMEEEFYRRFPQYASLAVPRRAAQHALVFTTTHGVELEASAVSDGAVLYLAFLALTHQPDPPRTLLVEEPENGVHYSSLSEIVRVLRALSSEKKVRVVVTTHSPYLLDLVEPEEVRLFEKDANGAARARRMSEVPDMDDLKKHFMTGEIWTNLMDVEKARAGEPKD